MDSSYKTVKLQEEEIENCWDVKLGKALDLTPKTLSIKGKEKLINSISLNLRTSTLDFKKQTNNNQKIQLGHGQKT